MTFLLVERDRVSFILQFYKKKKKKLAIKISLQNTTFYSDLIRVRETVSISYNKERLGI